MKLVEGSGRGTGEKRTSEKVSIDREEHQEGGGKKKGPSVVLLS